MINIPYQNYKQFHLYNINAYPLYNCFQVTKTMISSMKSLTLDRYGKTFVMGSLGSKVANLIDLRWEHENGDGRNQGLRL